MSGPTNQPRFPCHSSEHGTNCTRRAIRVTAWLLLCGESALAGRAAWPPRTDLPSLEVVTPHVPWAKPYPGKRLRALVIGDFRSQRLCVELMQRLDLECVAFNCPGGAYSVDLGGDPGLKALGKQLREPFDLVIAPGNLIGLLPPDLTELFIDRIREGLGFVYLWPASQPFRLLSELGKAPKPPTDAAGEADMGLGKEQPEDTTDEEVPLELDDQQPGWEREGLAYLTRGAPLSRLAGLQPSTKKEGGTPLPSVSVHRCGKGRAVLIGRPGSSVSSGPRLPVPEGRSDLLYEYYMALVVKAALWAAGHEPQIRFSHLQRPAGEGDEPRLTFSLRNMGAPQRIDLTLAVRTDRDLHSLPGTPWAEPGVHRSATVLTPIHAETRSIQLPKGDQTFTFSLPSLPAGSYFVDVRVIAEGKNANWAIVPWTMPGAPSIAGIAFRPEAVNLAEDPAIRARVDLAYPALAGAALDAALVDNHHRVLRRRRIPLEVGARTVELAFDVAGAKTTLFKLRAAMQVGGRTLDMRTGYFTAYNRPWPTFTYFAWGCGSSGSYLSRQLHRVAAFHGMDASFSGVGQSTLRVADLRSVGGVAGHHGKVEPGEMIVNPCVTSPAYRAGLRNVIRGRAQSRRVSDCFGYTTGDETAYAGGLFAGCASETCTARLHGYLRRQYGTIEALNRQWETQYNHFAEIRPIGAPAAYNKRAAKTGNFSARIDQWLANYDAYMDWFRYLDEALEHYTPRARFGFMTNCFYGHERGYDFPGMMEVCDFASPYCGWPPYFDCVQNFGSPDLIFGGHTVTRGLDRFREDSWKTPFWVLLRGGRNAWYYLFTIGGEGAVRPYLDLDPCLDAYSKAVQTIKRGPADLLSGAKREVDPVAVYYSTPSLIFSSAVSGPRHIIAIKPFNRQLRYLGFQNQIIHRQQLLAGALEKRGIRFLALPMAQCVSDREAAILRDFVEKGGLLIADHRPGIADEHGRLFAQRDLPRLFGLRWEKDLLAPDGKGLVPIRSNLDKALHLDGARARGEKDGVPILTVNEVGRGKAICLNSGLPMQLYHDLLAEHGLTPAMDIRGKEDAKRSGPGWPGVGVHRFTDGEARYFGITGPRSLDQVVIRPGSRGHVYDLLRGEYLGEADRIDVKDFPRLVRIFSFLPYRVAELRLRCEKEAYPGGAILGTVKVSAGGAAPVRHVIHLSLQRPDGKSVRYLEQNLETKEGEATFVVPLALNEPTGQWTLRARDVATGVETSATVTLVPRSGNETAPAPGFQVHQHQTVPSWEQKSPTVAELAQEYQDASLHRRIDIVGRLRTEKANQTSLGLLRRAVQDPDPVLCWSAVQTLGALGPEAAPAASALAAALGNTTGIRKDILKVFRQIGAEAIREALPIIAECLDSANPRVRFETLRTIAAARRSKSVDARRRVVRCFDEHDQGTKHLDCNVLAAYLEALAVFPVSEEDLSVYKRAVEGFPMAIRLNEGERRTVSHGELVRKLARFTYYDRALKRLHANNFAYRLMAVQSLRALGEKAEAAIPAAVRALEDTVRKRSKLSSGTRIQIWLNREPNPSAPADNDFQVAHALCRFLATHGEKAEPALPVLRRLQDLEPRLAQTARAAMQKIDPLAEAGHELEGGAGAGGLDGDRKGKDWNGNLRKMLDD